MKINQGWEYDQLSPYDEQMGMEYVTDPTSPNKIRINTYSNEEYKF